MYKIIDGKVVKIEQFETVTEVTSESIKEQIDALSQSQESISKQIEVLNSELKDVENLEAKIKWLLNQIKIQYNEIFFNIIICHNIGGSKCSEI